MKVIFSSEKGFYLDYTAAKSLFPRNSEYFASDTFDELFRKIDLNPSYFGIIPIEDSVTGTYCHIIEQLFKRRYKVFGEVFLGPEVKLFYSKDLTPKTLKDIYCESNLIQFISPFLKKEFENINLIPINNLEEVIEPNPYQMAFISTKSFVKESDFEISSIDIKGSGKFSIRYFVVGRAFFDLPSDDSDKVLLILKVSKSVEKEHIEEELNKEGLKLFKIEENKKSEDNDHKEFYLEVGFYGLLDLEGLEKMSKEINILGIFESGKVIHL